MNEKVVGSGGKDLDVSSFCVRKNYLAPYCKNILVLFRLTFLLLLSREMGIMFQKDGLKRLYTNIIYFPQLVLTQWTLYHQMDVIHSIHSLELIKTWRVVLFILKFLFKSLKYKMCCFFVRKFDINIKFRLEAELDKKCDVY